MPNSISKGVNFTPSIFTPIQYNPTMPDLNLLGNTINSMNEKHLKTLENRAAIAKDLANSYKLDPMFDGWKHEFTNEMLSRIDNSIDANSGYAGNALSETIKVAGDYVADHRLLGRQQFSDAKSTLLKSVDKAKISDRHKQFLKTTANAVPYADKKYGETDEEALDNRNTEAMLSESLNPNDVVGGTKFNPIFDIIEDVDLYELEEKALKNVAKKAGGGEKLYYRNAAGNYVEDPNESIDNLPYYKIGNTYHAITKEDLYNAIDGAIKGTNGAEESLNRQYEVDKWYHKKQLASTGKSILVDDFTDSNGNELSYGDWLRRKTGSFVASSSYYNSSSTISSDVGISALKSSAGSGNSEGNPEMPVLTSGGHNVLTKGDNVSTIKANANSLDNYIIETASKYSSDFTLDSNGNVDRNKPLETYEISIIEGINNDNNLSEYEKLQKIHEVQNAFKQRKQCNETLSALVNASVSDEDLYNTIQLISAVEGGPSITEGDGDLLQDYNNLFNELITSDEKDNTGGNIKASYIKILFENDSDRPTAFLDTRNFIDKLYDGNHIDKAKYKITNNAIYIPVTDKYAIPLITQYLLDNTGIADYGIQDVTCALADANLRDLKGGGWNSGFRASGQNIFTDIYKGITEPALFRSGSDIKRALYALNDTYNHNKWWYEEEINNISIPSFYSESLIFGRSDAGSLLIASNPGLKTSDKNALLKEHDNQVNTILRNNPFVNYVVRIADESGNLQLVDNAIGKRQISNLLSDIYAYNKDLYNPYAMAINGKLGSAFNIELLLNPENEKDKNLLDKYKDIKINGNPIVVENTIRLTTEIEGIIDDKLEQAILNSPKFQIDRRISIMRKRGQNTITLENGGTLHLSNNGFSYESSAGDVSSITNEGVLSLIEASDKLETFKSYVKLNKDKINNFMQLYDIDLQSKNEIDNLLQYISPALINLYNLKTGDELQQMFNSLLQ